MPIAHPQLRRLIPKSPTQHIQKAGPRQPHGINRGTINVVLANVNGMVVLTDSRITRSYADGRRVPLPQPQQKLFQLDSRTICTFAGFTSTDLPLDPEVANSITGILLGYKLELSAKKYNPDLRQKLDEVVFIAQNQLSLVANIKDVPAEARARLYDLELTMAGYDTDGKAKIVWADLTMSTDHNYAMTVRDSGEEVVGKDLTSHVRGMRENAERVLHDPSQNLDDPAIRRYMESQRPGAIALTMPEMRELAIALSRITAANSEGMVGGDDQIATFEMGTLRIEQHDFPIPTLTRHNFWIEWQGIVDGVPISLPPPGVTLLFVKNIVKSTDIPLDGGYFYGNTFYNCVFTYDGGNTKFADNNDVGTSMLLLGPKVDIRSGKAAQLLRQGWSSVIYQKAQWEYSPALQTLIKQAKSESRKPIHFIFSLVKPGALPVYQGINEYGPDEIRVRVSSGVSRNYDETILAYQVFRVVLHNRGFGSNGGVLGQIPGTSVQDSRASLEKVGVMLNSCFSNALVDDQILKRGFNPSMLTDREAELMTAGLTNAAGDQGGAIEQNPIFQQAAGLSLYCLAIRRRPSTILGIEAVAQRVNPGVVKVESELLKQFGRFRCTLADPKGCYTQTLHLRDALGMKDLIEMRPMIAQARRQSPSEK